ncbi:MAG: ABC transporter ATP-binding protein/permease [Burkholderiaceae bacterium]|nr:ABC transporter ATP-binding protein/permease [Burkholderiales bacterium]MCZ8338036.1 ABC transporter ATP-binding protein/permease [Burkholderiaceae bacterium]
MGGSGRREAGAALSAIDAPARDDGADADAGRIEQARFDLARLRRFWAIAGPFWRSEERWRAGVLVALLALLLLGQTAFNLQFVRQSGELTSALAAGDADRFWSAIRFTLALLAVAVPIWATYYWVRDTLGLHWRRWLTRRFLDAWLGNRAYYALGGRGDIDNPDQRIAEDVATFTQQSLYFLMVALGAAIQLAAFVALLWSISRELVYFLVGYAVFGTVMTTAVFGRPMVGLNFRQLRREADFRFGLVRIREHAEAIAFSHGERDETERAMRGFERVFRNVRRLLRMQFGLNLFQYTFSFLTIVLPSAIIANRVLSGELEVGHAVQAGGAFTAILAALTVVVDHFEGLSRLSAGVDRLYGFARSLDAHADGASAVAPLVARPPAAPPEVDDGPRIATVAARRLALERVTVQTPDRLRTLLADLTIEVEPGRGLLIVGGSGGGKSSLLRAIAGLWTAGTGRIERPGPDQMTFLPQHPYMALGTLREQLLYPDRARRIDDAALLALLERVNLGELPARLGGLDAAQDWAKVLSIGEQQRLAFARVLLAEPRYAMLDEATSALDAANEERLYLELAATRTTAVSVSHRQGVVRYHDRILELPGDGTWRIVPADGYRLE